MAAPRLRSVRVASVVAATALGAIATVGQSARGASVHPVPSSTGHILAQTLSFPPDTAFCRANLHLSCYQPAQLVTAYNLDQLFDTGLDGRGRTIVIVDSFGSPTITEDLAQFDRTFGLPDPPSFRIIQPAGAVPAYPQDPFGAADRSGWAAETTLDVEWTHVIAPRANILLVETPTSETEGVQGFPEIVAAENYVIDHNLGDVISQSFAATEETFPSRDSILDLRSAFVNARRHHVTVLGASGDQGASGLLSDTNCCYPFRVDAWPSSDPLVTSVGGTQLLLDALGHRLAPDVAWNDGHGATGGGLSTVFARPDFQDDVRNVVGSHRGTPDISMSAAVDGGVDLYYSFCDYHRIDPSTGTPPLCGPQWHIAGGTSEASPLLAGVIAIADQALGHRLGYINPRLYDLEEPKESGIVDVTAGNNSWTFCASACHTSQEVDVTVPGFNATKGYDLTTGWGTLDAAKFVRAMRGD